LGTRPRRAKLDAGLTRASISRDAPGCGPGGRRRRLTVDEEISALDDALRRLKVEFDVYFGGGSRQPPLDLDWRVQSLIKKFSDSQKLSFAQRYRYNSISERYAKLSDLWRQKLRIREEGYRRPEDAAFAIQGLRTEQERAAARALCPASVGPDPADNFVIECRHPEAEAEQVRLLFDVLVAARRRLGEPEFQGTFQGFLLFLVAKTGQICREYACPRVEYRIQVRDGCVRLRSQPRGGRGGGS